MNPRNKQPERQWTRPEYMAGRVSHDTYYRSLAKAAGVSFANSDHLPRIVQAYQTDHNLNGIPLAFWDRQGAGLASNPAYKRALKAHLETDTLAVRVCVLKAAAREAVRTISANKKGAPA